LGAGGLQFEVNGSERLRITSGGNIGINTTTFAANGTNLKVSDGTISRLALDKTGADARKFEIGNFGTGLNIYDVTADVERVRIDSVGNMGIGGSPLPTSTGYNGATLHLSQSAGTGGSALRMTNGNTGHTTSDGFYMGFWDDGHLYFYNQEAGHIIFGTNGTDRGRITSTGNFGINTTNPATKLDVRPTAEDPTTGSPAAGSFLQIRADDATVGKGPSLALMNLSGSKETGWRLSALTASGNNGDFTIHGYGGGATYSEYLRISADGKVHIGGNGTATDQLNIIGAGNGINISRSNSGSPSANDSLGALGFKGYATGNSSAAADAKIHAAASHNHSGSSAPANLIFSTKPTTTGPGSAPTERMRLTHDGKLMIGGTDIGGTNASRLGMTYGNSTGNYIEMGGTNRNANGLSKLVTMRHGYWGGAREVASLGFLTSSSGGGAGRGTGNFVVHTGSSGNGDGAGSGDNLSIERLRVDSSGAFYVNTVSAVNWSQTSNSSNSDNSNSNNPSGNMCFRTSEGALILANDADSGYSAIYINKYDWNSGDDNRWINFYLNGSGKDSITWNGSNIVYGNNSDYRIKTNIRSYTGGIDLVKQIQVRQYDYIETERGTDHVGFIAHELQEVLPDAVSGEKDGMRIEEETGEEVMNIQNVEYGKVTPLLTAALKEAIAKIETLEARITALEG
jgi:hypothetical protein